MPLLKLLASDLAIAVRGILMGGADVIPGVSGGTVALIVGIYQRLVTAISRFDLELLKHLTAGRWLRAAAHIDLRFLVALASGVVAGILLLGGLVHELLGGVWTRPLTLSAFLGAILASALIVARMVRPRNRGERLACIALGVLGALGAWVLTGLPVLARVEGQPHLGYTFACGVVAICAMILPGISGAYILLILGMYEYVIGVVKGLPRGEATPNDLVTLAVFGCGCAVGLLGFARFLRWLLARHEPPTIALLCGLMVGATRKIWPLEGGTAPGGLLAGCAAAAVIAAAAVLALHRLARRGDREFPSM